MNRGDIYLVDLNPSHGHEQQGRRPVLIISPDSFNNATGVPVILPITHGGAFAERIGFAVEITGITTTGIVRCDQPRAIDIAARNGRHIDTLPQAILDDVMAKVITIFE
ncbi:type II toxin-antitoxin system PemK/MazF family toxin [Candidatus Obscuribacterales bacterium]|jgi:mRNA interferase ChpB|nr:type II toxin-antitoxin system PemK/MazF family toxin [Candidatus Obscuribacterales bacterium]